MAIPGWNLLTSEAATSRRLRVLRQSAIEASTGPLVLSKKYMQLYRPGFTHKALYGGRGTAKTTSIASYCVLRMDAAPTYVAGLRKTHVGMRHSTKRALERAIHRLGLTHRFEITAFEIRNKITGSLAFFRGLEHDSDETTRGLDGVDIFWLDEARNVSHEALQNLLRVIRERGAELLTSWNPLDPEDPIEKLYRTGTVKPQNTLLIPTTIEDNPAFFASPMADEYWRLKVIDEQLWRHTYGGEYDLRAGVRIYDNAETGIVPDKYLDGLRPANGMDIGYVNDPTVVTRSWVLDEHKTIYVQKEAVGYGSEIEDMKDLLDLVLDDPTELVIADNSEPRTTDALNRDGYNIQRTPKGGGTVIGGIRMMKGYRMVINPSCTTTIDETKRYRWKIDKQGNRTNTPIGPDHCLDSIRYAVMAHEDGDDSPENYVMVEVRRGEFDWVHKRDLRGSKEWRSFNSAT